MTTTSKALQALANEHLIECFQLATQMQLDTDFIVQLKTEIELRQLDGLTSHGQLANRSKPSMFLNATG